MKTCTAKRERLFKQPLRNRIVTKSLVKKIRTYPDKKQK